MTGSHRSGLGRGLSALFPSAADLERAALAPEERVLHDLVNAGLDQLEATAALDICGYLHVPAEGEAALFLRRPPLDTLSPTRAYRLFTHLERARQGPADETTFVIDSLAVVFRRTTGPAADGVHLLGRDDGPMDERELSQLRWVADTFAAICHQYAAGLPRNLCPPPLSVDVQAGEATVEVHLLAAGGSRRAVARAERVQDAVAIAVLEATATGLSFRSAGEVPVETGRAALVMAEDEQGRTRPGFVLGAGDVIQCTALAALRAATGF